jgi:hypothetical protein
MAGVAGVQVLRHDLGCEAAYSDFLSGYMNEEKFRAAKSWSFSNDAKTCGEALDKGLLVTPVRRVQEVEKSDDITKGEPIDAKHMERTAEVNANANWERRQ